MKTRNQLSNTIQNVSLVVCDLVIEQLYTKKVNGYDLDRFIDLVTSGQCITFDTNTAKFQFNTLVRNWINTNFNNLYINIFPPIGYDKNGNQTTNKSKWA